jgi:hypothetical protein
VSLKFNQYTLGTAPTLLFPELSAQGATITFTNGNSSLPCYIGSGSNVTVSNGAPIPPNGVVSMSNVVSGTAGVYGVAGTVSVVLGIFYGDIK